MENVEIEVCQFHQGVFSILNGWYNGVKGGVSTIMLGTDNNNWKFEGAANILNQPVYQIVTSYFRCQKFSFILKWLTMITLSLELGKHIMIIASFQEKKKFENQTKFWLSFSRNYQFCFCIKVFISSFTQKEITQKLVLKPNYNNIFLPKTEMLTLRMANLLQNSAKSTFFLEYILLV